jgi:transcriptional regulator GlxA family with amidase domain
MVHDVDVQIALVVYDGVLGDECASFRSVLERLPGSEFVTVGGRRGPMTGPGGAQSADVSFDEVPAPDIVVVPGGLGCERVAHDLPLRRWLTAVSPRCRWIVGSSTGSIVLAAAGLLDGTPAATHWLAVGLLERYGVEHSHQRLQVTGNIVTCEGRVTALDAAFTIVEQCAGESAVAAIRHQLLEHAVADTCPRRWFRRLRTDRPARPSRAPAAPSTVMVELTDEARRPARRHRPPR